MTDDIFMAYDIRGRDISTHDSFLIGRSIGSELKGKCFIGWDCRKTSPALAEHLIEGLRSSGIECVVGGLMPGPVAYFKTMSEYDFGVYITASHLPAEYNGFKIIVKDGSSLSPERLLLIKDRFKNYDFTKENPVPVSQDITALNDYARFLKEKFGRLDVSCVIDCFNASTGLASERVFKNLLNATVINSEPLGDFGGKQPEPSEDNLQEVVKQVKSSGAAFGVGLDGDGDRSVFVDELGRVIDGNKMTLLFAREVLKRTGGGVIVVPVSVSNVIESMASKLNGSVVWCEVGHTFIEKELIKHKGVFGGEVSSHFYFNEHYPFSDGIMSTLQLAKILSESNKKFSELINELPKVVVVKGEVEFKSHKQKNQVAQALARNLLIKHPDAITIDGVKFVDEDVSVLLRPSQTRETVKTFIEAGEPARAKAKLSEYMDLITKLKSE